MKNPQQGSKQIILEEQNYFIKIYKDLKDSIFNVLFVILDKEESDDDDESMLSLVFESGIDYLQMFAFSFDIIVIGCWNGGETLDRVSQLFGKLNIASYLPGVSFDAFLLLLYALILLIVLVILDIVYVSYSFSRKKFKFTWPLVILSQLVPLFVTILFLPITETLLSVVRCETKENQDYQVMISFPQILCWEGWHLFHAAVTLLFSSLFVLISSIVSLALFEPRMSSKKLTARQNSRGQVIFIMNKIICQLVFSFRPFQETFVYNLMLLVLSGWLYWTYNMNDPFYNKKVSKFFKILSSYYFWTNFMMFVSQLLEFSAFNGGFIVWISGLPFIGLVIGFEQKSDINDLFNSNLRFKSGIEMEKHIRYVLQLIQNKDSDKNAYMLITGYIQKHKQICLEDDCPLKFTTRWKNKKKAVDDEEINLRLLQKIEKMYKLGIKKFPECTQLRISFAFFNMERMNNKNAAYQAFSYALKQDPTFEEEFIIYRFKKIIRQNLQDNKDDSLDLIELIRFDNHVLLCEEAMFLSAHLHKQFWSQLKEETPDLKELNKLGAKITVAANSIKQNYNEIFKTKSSVPELLYSYAIYLILVVKDTKQGKQLMEFSKKIYSNVKKGESKDTLESFDTINSNIENPMISVSMKKKSFCKITSINSLFTELTGYNKQQLLDRNLQKLLPEVLAVIHEEAIENQLDSWKTPLKTSAYLNQSHFSYIRVKSGHIIPIQYIVSYHQSFEKCFITFKAIQNLSKNTCHLIVDSNGIIKDISRMGSFYFGYEKKYLIEKQESVESMGIKNIEQAYNEAKIKQNQETIFLQQHLKFNDNSRNNCKIYLEEIKLKIRRYQAEDNSDDEDCMIKNREFLVGYSLKIISDKFDQRKENPRQIMPIYNQQSHLIQNEANEQSILELYDDPNFMDLFIMNLADTRQFETQFKPFVLTTKIKTMRLINNQVRMTYNRDNNFDDNKKSEMEDEIVEGEYDAIKLNDESYHSKIRKAINTDLNHVEVKRLKIAVILIILGLIVANVLCLLEILSHYENIDRQAEAYLNKTKISIDLYKFLLPTTTSNKDSQALYTQINAYQIIYEQTQRVNLTTIRGNNIEKTIEDALRYQLSVLASYYQLEAHQSDKNLNQEVKEKLIKNLYGNYIVSLYPFLKQIHLNKIYSFIQPEELIRIILLTLAYIFVPISLFYGYWIYINLKINHKKMKILLWFLDIPVSYVSILYENCDGYIKNFMSIKDIMKKGIDKSQFDQFEELITEKDSNQYDISQEQEKSRRSIAVKQNKKRLCSNCKSGDIKMGWMAVYGLIFWIFSTIYLSTFREIMDYYYMPYYKTSEQILKSNYLVLASSIQYLTTYDENEQLIQEQKLDAQGLFENYHTDSTILQFNLKTLTHSSNPVLSEAITNYNLAFLSNICDYLQLPQDDQCQEIAGSSLKGSFRTFSMYLIDSEISNDPETLNELKIATTQYTSTALYKVLELWRNLIYQKVNEGKSIISVAFYLFIFVGMIILSIIWIAYLAKINKEMNESIKMLNMIPFKLLSTCQKQTRDFIVWLIRQANHILYSDSR